VRDCHHIITCHTNDTVTDKFSGFHGAVAVSYFGADGKLIRSDSYEAGCQQAPVFGAAHRSVTWNAVAPPGTMGFSITQYHDPHSIFETIASDLGTFFSDIGDVIKNGAEGLTQWVNDHPNETAAIATAVFIIGGTALCIALGPGVCEIVITVALGA
jgi:hypothetical protein